MVAEIVQENPASRRRQSQDARVVHWLEAKRTVEGIRLILHVSFARITDGQARKSICEPKAKKILFDGVFLQDMGRVEAIRTNGSGVKGNAEDAVDKEC